MTKLNNLYYEWLIDHYGTIGWQERFAKYIARVEKSMFKDNLHDGITQFCKDYNYKKEIFKEFL